MSRKSPSSRVLGHVPGWVLIALGVTLSTGLGIAVRWSQAKASGNTELVGIYEVGTVVGVSSFCVIALLLTFQFQPSLRRAVRLRMLYPDRPNYIIRLDPPARSALRSLLGNPLEGLPFLTIGLIISPAGLEFWTGSSNPLRLGVVEWRAVEKVSVATGEYARRAVDKLLVEPVALSRPVSVPIGATVGLGWGFESRETVEAVVETIEGFRLAAQSA